MEGKLPEEQVKTVLAPWKFSLHSSGFEKRLVTALELYDQFPLDIAVTGGTREANVRLAAVICGLRDEEKAKTDGEEGEDDDDDYDDDDDDDDDDGDDDDDDDDDDSDGGEMESDQIKNEEEDKHRQVVKKDGKDTSERKVHVRIAGHTNIEEQGSDSEPLFLHPQVPNIRIWTIEGSSGPLQHSYDVLVVLTTELHQEDHLRLAMEHREKDKHIYFVRAEQEWDLVQKPEGPCKTCEWERMRARNLELQKKHKLELDSAETGDHKSSSGFPQTAKLLQIEETGGVLLEALPELRKKAFSQFLVDITRELRVPKASTSGTAPLVFYALNKKKITREDLDHIAEVFQPRDVTDNPSKLISVLTALEHFRLDVGVLGETGCGSSTLFNSLLGLKDTDEGASSTGVTETTQEPVSHPYPVCHNVFLWDLPGLGRLGDLKIQSGGFSLYQAQSLPANLPPCDVYILVSPLKLSLSSVRLFQQLSGQGKACYMVLSKADLIEEKSLGEVRNWSVEVLEKVGLKQNVFLVSALHPETLDFAKLKETLTEALPKLKRDALASYVPKLLEQDVFWKRAEPCKLM